MVVNLLKRHVHSTLHNQIVVLLQKGTVCGMLMHQLVVNVSKLNKLVHLTKEQMILFVQVIEISARQLQLHLHQIQLV